MQLREDKMLSHKGLKLFLSVNYIKQMSLSTGEFLRIHHA